MKKILYIILFCILIFESCGSDKYEADDILMVTNVDLSDFKIYAGSPEGGKEVQFNDLKKTDLATRFFGTAYRNNLYDKIEIQFNDKKLTFIDSTGTSKIISDFEFQGDSLFVKKHDGGKVFVALGTSDNLYRMKGLSRYRLNESKDTIRVFNEPLGLDKMLTVRGLSSLNQMTDPTDTLIWCNAIYIFK
ncbi:MAG: hypothetical protein LBN74_07095 [Prevotella sp.]|jgi:hypothetical protein|nr:hypothetical protein [Prevotella sp.]